MVFNDFEELFEQKIKEVASADDPAHDFLHFKRVVKSAKLIAAAERANLDIVVPAAWLHDLVIVPKDSPKRGQASKLSAEAAIHFLTAIKYPEKNFEAIFHAIEAHSFSANIETKSLEAMVVQDADRLDGLGAIGIGRCFATSGLLKRPFYSEHDPFCAQRAPNDKMFCIDHFYAKLFKTAQTMKTRAGMQEAEKRVEHMRAYLKVLESEIDQ